MKKIIFKSVKLVLSIVLSFCVTTLFAQDYLINFVGEDDTIPSTVKIDNLMSSTTVTLNGGDILHLTSELGISTPGADNGSLIIYPNPMAEKSVLTFTALESGNTVISIIDISGKIVCQISKLLSSGTHSFRVSGINQGIFFVKVAGINYNYSTKLISKSNMPGGAGIEYISYVKNTTSNPLKKTAATVDMHYTDGDILMYKGMFGDCLSTIITDTPASSKTITFNFMACIDSDGNCYSIVKIGNQTWMAENLNVGTRINGSLNQTNNSTIEKYCYNDLVSNCNIYGGLYQWDEAMQFVITEGTKGICPTGWHFPTYAEWNTLRTFLGGYPIAGGKMKEAGFTHWTSPNTGANNSSGFTALPGGHRSFDGIFQTLNYDALFNSSSLNGPFTVGWLIHNNEEYLWNGNLYKTEGVSVRCIKN